jgi:FixH.
MDWGKGILLSIIAFVGIIMTMVVISVRMDGIELVRDNYYEAEIKYQEQIDRESSTLLLDRDVLAFDSQSKAVILDLPKGAKGNLNLYRPSDVKLDQSVPVEIIESGKNKYPSPVLNLDIGEFNSLGPKTEQNSIKRKKLHSDDLDCISFGFFRFFPLRGNVWTYCTRRWKCQ